MSYLSYRKRRSLLPAGRAEDVGPKALGREEPYRVPSNVLKRPIKLPPMQRIKA